MAALTIFAVIVVILPTPTPKSQLPAGYEISCLSYVERESGEIDQITVEIATFLWSGNINESPNLSNEGCLEIVGADSFLWEGKILPMERREGNVSALTLYEKGEDSVLITWRVSLFEEKERWSIFWAARLSPNERIVLPTGESITFVGLDSSEVKGPLYIIE